MIWGYPHFLYLQSMVKSHLRHGEEAADASQVALGLGDCWFYHGFTVKNGGLTWFSHPDIGNRCT